MSFRSVSDEPTNVEFHIMTSTQAHRRIHGLRKRRKGAF